MNFLQRLTTMIRKEFLQLVRDNSSISIGAVLPIVLILLIGYGISLDVKNVPVTIVLEDSSPTARNAVNFLNGSEYFSPYYVNSFKDAQDLMDARKVDAILVVPLDFTMNFYDRTAKIQLILYGVNNMTATAVKGYIESGIQSFNAHFYGSFATNGVVTLPGDVRLYAVPSRGKIFIRNTNARLIFDFIAHSDFISVRRARNWTFNLVGNEKSIFIVSTHADYRIFAVADVVGLYFRLAQRSCMG